MRHGVGNWPPNDFNLSTSIKGSASSHILLVAHFAEMCRESRTICVTASSVSASDARGANCPIVSSAFFVHNYGARDCERWFQWLVGIAICHAGPFGVRHVQRGGKGHFRQVQHKEKVLLPTSPYNNPVGAPHAERTRRALTSRNSGSGRPVHRSSPPARHHEREREGWWLTAEAARKYSVWFASCACRPRKDTASRAI